MGVLSRVSSTKLLACPDQHVSPRKLDAHHIQHVDTVDLRRQCGRQDGAFSLPPLLYFMRDCVSRCASDNQSQLITTNRRRLRRYRRSDGSLLPSLPIRPHPYTGPHILFPPFYRGPGRIVLRHLVLHPVLQRSHVIVATQSGRRHSLVGPHRRVHCGGRAWRCLCKEALYIGSSTKIDFSRPDPKIQCELVLTLSSVVGESG